MMLCYKLTTNFLFHSVSISLKIEKYLNIMRWAIILLEGVYLFEFSIILFFGCNFYIYSKIILTLQLILFLLFFLTLLISLVYYFCFYFYFSLHFLANQLVVLI